MSIVSSIVFVFISCSLVEMEEVVNPRTVPSAKDEVLPLGAPLEIHFPHEPEPDSILGILEVRDYWGPLEGRAECEKTLVSYYPEEKPVPGLPYFLSLSGSYSTIGGKPCYVNLELTFFWGKGGYEAPLISTIVPENGGVISPEGTLRIIFTGGLDTEKVASELRIFPDHRITKQWEQEEDQRLELVIIPDIPWNVDTYYTVAGLPPESLGETGFWVEEEGFPTIQSLSRVEPDWEHSFPLIASGLDGIAPAEAISIRFSLAMDDGSVTQAFSISPEIEGRILWPEKNNMIFIPEEPFLQDTRYMLHLGRKAASSFGSPMREDYTISFDPANPFLLLSRVEGRPEDGFPLMNPESVEDPLTLTFSPGNGDYTFRFAFTDSFDTLSVKEKTQDWIHLKRLYPSSGTVPVKTGATWINDSLLSLSWSGFSNPGPGRSVYYFLVVPGGKSGIINSRERTLEKTISIPLKVEGS